jgi:Tol biopolymer transport system component
MKNKIENFQSRHSWFAKLVSVAVILAFIAPVITNAQAGKTDFSGSWTMNESKSTQPPAGAQGGGMRMGNLVAKQEANLLTVERTRTGQDGQPQTTTMKYTLDGKESVNTTPRGESKSVTTWSADGKSLTIKTTSDFNGNTFTSTSVWSLTDAKTLSVVTTSPDRNGGADRVMKMVYDKK